MPATRSRYSRVRAIVLCARFRRCAVSSSGRPSVSTAEPIPLTRPEVGDGAHLAAQRVLPLRHPLRWVAVAVVLVVLAQVVHGLVTNPFYQWDRFAYWFLRPVVLNGL